MFNLLFSALLNPKLGLQDPPKCLQQDLEADFGDGGIIPPLAELVSDECVLCPGKLVPAECDSGFPELGADQVAPCVRHMGVFDAKDQGDLTTDPCEQINGVVGVWWRGGGCDGLRVRTEGTRMNVGCEVGDCCSDGRVKLERNCEDTK